MRDLRYFFSFMIAIGLIILIIFLMFGGGKPKAPVTPRTLISYTRDSDAVRLTIDGPINADQNHQGVQITVDNSSIVYEQLQGYQASVANQQSFENNSSAFAVFLHALSYAGFTKGNLNKNLSDERGYCPLGDRYVFELLENGNDIERYWATSCGGTKTYLGNLDLTLSVFKAQVPGYNNLTQSIQF